MVRRRVCIISFSPIEQDARVLRQIEYLSTRYALTIIGYGDRPLMPDDVEWRAVPTTTRWDSLMSVLLLSLARLIPRFYDVWYWQKPRHRLALRFVRESHSDVVYANEWGSLPVAVEAGGASVVLDLHEYSPEAADARWWRFLFAPAVRYFLSRYVPTVGVAITVSPTIATRYQELFPREWHVIRNVPKQAVIPSDGVTSATDELRLVHHGAALRDRRLETMIDVLALTNRRTYLDFMLIGDAAYIAELKRYAEERAPGKVYFRTPVSPPDIVREIAVYDAGIFVLEPSHYSYREALPNKLFDFINAGLAVFIGPSPAMAEIVRRYQVGRVAESFQAADVARVLDAVTVEEIAQMKCAARVAAKELNADVEMAKLLELIALLIREDR